MPTPSPLPPIARKLLTLPLFTLLTEEQQNAVFEDHPRMVVLAGAGAGKTRVLVARLAWLLWGAHPTPPEELLAISFTRKACGEIRHRLQQVARELDIQASLPPIDTFHATALKWVRRSNQRVPHIVGEGQDARTLLGEFLKQDKALMDAEVSLDRLEDALHHPFSGLFTGRELAEVKGRLLDFKLREGKIEVEDLIFLALRIFEQGNPPVRDRRPLAMILVDEAQDMDDHQARFLDFLQSAQTHLTLFGDDDQAIYRWRGSNPAHLRRLARDPSTRVISLSINHRSTPAIVELSREVISKDPERLQKEVRASRPAGARVRCVAHSQTLVAVLEEVRRRLEDGEDPQRVGILVRDHVDLGAVRDILRRHQIPTGEEGILIQTYHSAKGLEYPIVLLPFLDQGRFPNTRRLKRDETNLRTEAEEAREAAVALGMALADHPLEVILAPLRRMGRWIRWLVTAKGRPAQLRAGDATERRRMRRLARRAPALTEALGKWREEKRQILAEERRLCYVALTRARDELVIFCRERDKVSPFLAKLPRGLVGWEESEES